MGIDDRQKLAIHAKQVTIKVEDQRLLRDLIYTIDTGSSLGAISSATAATQRRHNDEEHSKLMKQRALAIEQARALDAKGEALPKKLAHFLKGIHWKRR